MYAEGLCRNFIRNVMCTYVTALFFHVRFLFVLHFVGTDSIYVVYNKRFNPLKPSVIISLHFEYPALQRPNPPFLISDIRALWRSGLSARVPECQKLKMVG